MTPNWLITIICLIACCGDVKGCQQSKTRRVYSNKKIDRFTVRDVQLFEV